MYKKVAENAEEMATINLAKLRRAQAEADFDEGKYESILTESDITCD